MKNPPLPFLISIPHGGITIPIELKNRIQISQQELLADGDPFTGDIYDVEGLVLAQVKFAAARALIDVNRAPDDLPPQNPDGVIKMVSIFNNPVYMDGKEPKQDEITSLLKKYYSPYHKDIEEKLTTPSIVFAFDCHSMEAIGPPVARDAGKKRPLFCLGNNGGTSCTDEFTKLLAHCLAEAFSIPENSITFNKPFSGGYITQKYGMKPVPWLQIEMNRSLYMTDKKSTTLQKCRELNSCFRDTLHLFHDSAKGFS